MSQHDVRLFEGFMDWFKKKRPAGTAMGAFVDTQRPLKTQTEQQLLLTCHGPSSDDGLISRARNASKVHDAVNDSLGSWIEMFQDPRADMKKGEIKAHMEKVRSMSPLSRDFQLLAKENGSTQKPPAPTNRTDDPKVTAEKNKALKKYRTEVLNQEIQKLRLKHNMPTEDETSVIAKERITKVNHRNLHDECARAADTMQSHLTNISKVLKLGGTKDECSGSIGQFTRSSNVYTKALEKLRNGHVALGQRFAPFELPEALSGSDDYHKHTSNLYDRLTSMKEAPKDELNYSYKKPTTPQPPQPPPRQERAPIYDPAHQKRMERRQRAMYGEEPTPRSNPSQNKEDPRAPTQGMADRIRQLFGTLKEDKTMPKYLAENNDLYMKDAVEFARYILKNTGHSYSEPAVIDLANSMIERIKRFNLNEWRKRHRSKIQQYVSERIVQESVIGFGRDSKDAAEFEERKRMRQRLADQFHQNGHAEDAAYYDKKVDDYDKRYREEKGGVRPFIGAVKRGLKKLGFGKTREEHP